jgi:hypothetical protein
MTMMTHNRQQHLVLSHRAFASRNETSVSRIHQHRQQTRFLLMLSVAVIFCLFTTIRNTYGLTRLTEAYSALKLAIQHPPAVGELTPFHRDSPHDSSNGKLTAVSSSTTTRTSSILNITANSSDDINPRICFVTAQFLTNLMQADRLMNPMTRMDLYRSPNHYFLAFTNHPNFRPRGWTVLLRNYSDYRRDITKSRWPKFQGFNDPTIQSRCDVVFYMDGPCVVIGNTSMFRTVAQQVLQSSVGLAQTPHPKGGTIEDEFLRIVHGSKDSVHNVNKSLIWMNSQGDYMPDIPIYQNKFFAYNPKSLSFQRLANFFWDHYSLEQDSWRDQPLWAYSLHHLNMTPLVLSNTTLIKDVSRNRGMNGHRYDEAAEGLFMEKPNITLNVTDRELCFLNIEETGGDRLRAHFANDEKQIDHPPALPTLYRWRELQMDRDRNSDYRVKYCDFIVLWVRDPVERAIDAYNMVMDPQWLERLRNSGSKSITRKLRYLENIQKILNRFGDLNDIAEQLFDEKNKKNTSSSPVAARRTFSYIEQVRHSLAWYIWSDTHYLRPLLTQAGPFHPPGTASSWLTDPWFLSRLVFVGGNECYEQELERFATLFDVTRSYLEPIHSTNTEHTAVENLSPLAYKNLRRYFHEDYQVLLTLKSYGLLHCDKLIAKITGAGDSSKTFK